MAFENHSQYFGLHELNGRLWAGWVAQMGENCLSKHEALRWNPSAAKRKRNKEMAESHRLGEALKECLQKKKKKN
jgi:hypothetical protein